jgi:transcriptional regulator with XRE-family HTH domain
MIGRPAKSERSAFGQRLVAARLRLGLTQIEVASKIGVSQQAYAGWERRTVAIRPEYVARTAKVLGLELRVLLGENRSAVTPKSPSGRAHRTLLALSKLPACEQDRILDLVDDLVAVSRRKGKGKRPPG